MNGRKIKILLLDSNLGKGGGIDRYNSHLLDALKELGHTVEIAWLPGSSVLNKVVFSFSVLFKYFFFKPDIVFCGHIGLSPLAVLINKLSKVDYVVFTHGIDAWDIRKKIEIRALKNAKFVVSVSGFTAEKIIDQIPELESRIFLLPNTIDGKRFYPKEKSEKLIKKHGLDGKKVIFTLTRLSEEEEYKGYDKVIGALPAILKEVPEAVYVLGGKGGNLKKVIEMVKEAGLEKSVITPGFIPGEDLVDFYNLADVYAMPSKKEGFGIVFLEALACGIPVIAGNEDGSREPLLDGKLGFLVDPDDRGELVQKITAVLKGEVGDKRKINGDYLRKKTIESFGLPRFKGNVEKLVAGLGK